MISVEQAWDRIEATMPRRPVRRVAVDDAFNAILGQPVSAERDQPPFHRVMMDGIAIASAALAGGRAHFISQGSQAAGAAAMTLQSVEHCIEIMTGAALPVGADTIVPVENIELAGDRVMLRTPRRVRPGQFVHRRGSDYRGSTTLLQRGVRLGGARMAVLASSGLAEIDVAVAPRIGVVAVGDELIDPGLPIAATQIRRSNDFAIAALLAAHGLGSATRTRLPDDPGVLRERLAAALHEHEVLVLTGGVSMGKYDYIPAIMDELGVEIVLHKVAQKPGKPIWFGRHRDTVVFALPGNPVSSLVCARRYVVPAIETSMGHTAATEQVRLATAVETSGRLTLFAAVTMDARGEAVVRPTNTSGDFYTLADSTGFVELPAGAAHAEAGYVARLWRW